MKTGEWQDQWGTVYNNLGPPLQLKKATTRKDDSPGGFVLEITWEMQDVKNI